MFDNKYKHRLVHFDLKGAPPRISYLEKILPMLASWGATGIILEYEDTFPFSGKLSQLQNSSVYTVDQISEILGLCKRNNLEVIPLIQSFGHLEFVLKHDSFRELREMDLYPNALCPLHTGSLDLITSMASQVMELHSESSYLHIGADEVWHLGKCEKCLGEMEARGWSPSDLFLHWITKIAKNIKEKHPHLNIIIWDDMMRNIDASKLLEHRVGELVEPMIWKYEACDFNLPPGMFDAYSQVFERIWCASCFKGATGSTQFLPPIQQHIDNQLTWIGVINQHQDKFKEVRGIVLTGWQRYDHYAVLCELLPASLPCLALCLRVLRTESFRAEDHDAVSRTLGFEANVNVSPFPRPQLPEQGMTFPGHEIYVALQNWSNLVHKYQMICNSEAMLGWFSDYFRSRNFTNPAQVETILCQLLDLEVHLLALKKHMETSLLDVFYEETVEEWIGCFFTPLLQRVKNIVVDCRTQIKVGGRVRNYKMAKNSSLIHGAGSQDIG